MRILVIQPKLAPAGGGEGVCAWLLQALRDEHALTLLTWHAPDLDELNAFYGTSLRPGDVEVRLARRPARVLERRGRLLRYWSLLAEGRALPGFDLRVSVEEESDLGGQGRGLQYVHFPRHDPARTRSLAMRVYRGLAARVTGTRFERMKENVTIVNSDWTGRVVHRMHGLDSHTIHPPAAGEFLEVPWERRDDVVLSIGRVAREKRYERVIAVVEALRRRGHPLRLQLVLSGEIGPYGDGVLAAAAARPWISVARNLSRPRLLELMSRARYGLQAMEREHYGMAIAEMVRAGLLVFVPSGGGQVEIVDEPRLQWSGVGEAVDRIEAVLADEALRATLCRHLAGRAVRLGPEQFVTKVRALVGGLSNRPVTSRGGPL